MSWAAAGTWAGAGGAVSRQETWRALEASYKAGKLKAIGVSHFCPKQIADILAISTVPIAVNQVEYHVGMGHSAANETDGSTATTTSSCSAYRTQQLTS